MPALSTVFFDFLLSVCVAFAVQAPLFRSSPQNIVALVGNDVTIQCIVYNHDGKSQKPVWQHEIRVLSAGDFLYLPPENTKYSIEGFSNDTFNLRIRNITIDDAGNYSCQVTGGIQYSQLVVDVPPSIKFFPEGKTVTVVEESELSMTCRGDGQPIPVIQWIFHGKDGSREMHEHRDQETLMFSDISRSKAGEYECRATNGVGVPATHKIEVEVEYAPFLVYQVPVVYVAPGQDATIECFFSANPDVDIVNWHLNLSELNLERLSNVKDGHRKTDLHDVWSLDIREVRPHQLGLYSCQGENKIGTVSDTVILSPLPYDLKILGVQTDKYREQFTIRWTVSSPMKLLYFVIAIKQINDSYKTDWRNISIPVSVSHWTPSHTQEHTFLHLAASTNYTVLIKARNLYGYSDWSESLTIDTSESRGTSVEPKMSLLLMFLALVLLKNWDAVIH